MASCSSDPLREKCPSLAPAVLFAALYTLTTITHIYQAYHYSKPFTWVLIMGGVWEIIGMVMRVASIQIWTSAINSTSFMFILLAPLWINAFVYMTLGRLVYMYMPDRTLLRIGARRLGMLFVCLDISCFFIQLGGGVMTLDDEDIQRTKNGLKIYTAGTSIQEAVILTFVALGIVFSHRLKRENIERDIVPAKKLMSILYIVLALITYRIAFRILEFSAPFDSKVYRTINEHEYFIFIFDIVPMFVALVAFNIFHPGKTLQGPDSDYPKLTKEEKQETKRRKAELKRVRKDEHREGSN